MFQPLKTKGLTLVELGIAGLLLGALTCFVAIPEWIRARDHDWAKKCQENLTKIDGAKEQYALENNKKPGCPVGWTDIIDPTGGTGYLKEKPHCPLGHEYVINVVGTAPTCDTCLKEHALSQVGIAITGGE